MTYVEEETDFELLKYDKKSWNDDMWVIFFESKIIDPGSERADFESNKW